MECSFRVTQTFEGYYEGELIIEAKSKKEAISKIKKMSQEEISNNCVNWGLGYDTTSTDDIEVWNDGVLINE